MIKKCRDRSKIKHGFLMLFFCSALSLELTAKTFGQQLSLQVQNEPLANVLKRIEKQSTYTFFYNAKEVDVKTPVSINVKNKEVTEVIQILFEGKPYDLDIQGNVIVINKKKQAAPVGEIKRPKLSSQPAEQVSGRIIDSLGKPLSGVSVLVKGTSRGTVSDQNGYYRISVENNEVLVFKMIGFISKEIGVNGQKVIDIVLKEQTSGLNEVVVVAFGAQKKLTTIGAQSTVKAEDLKLPVANISNLIAGRVAGIVGVQRSGEPGYDNSEIYIRGISTFTSSSPLILVDGVERSFNNVDPEDIASFSVLKDASATALYGVRGANGVIIIQTKKGRAGKTTINVQYDQGMTEFTRLPQFADGVTYMEIANEAYKNSFPTDPNPRYSAERIAATKTQSDPDLNPDVNWMNVILNRYGHNRRARVNANGGSDKAQYYLSVGYYDETGMFKTDELAKYNSTLKFSRFNFTSNLTLNVTKTTKVDFGVSGWISNGNYPGSGTGSIFSAAYVLPPITIPARYSNGLYSKIRTGDVNNPYTILTQSGYTTEFRSQLWSNLRLTQNLDFLTPGLSITGMYSFDNYNTHQIARSKSVDGFLATGRNAAGELIFEQTQIGTNYLGYSRNNNGSRQLYLEGAINYTKTIKKHDFGAMLLYNQTDRVDAFAADFNSSIPFRYMGLAGRATYAYDTKYLAEVNFGYNGSETFAPNKRFGFFPSFGLGWIASQEKFFEPVKDIFSFLKMRFSYGIVGNSSIGGRRFAYISTITGQGSYNYGQNNTDNKIDGLNFGDYAVNVTWERAAKYNLGIEFKMLNDELSVTADVFREKRTGIFLQRGDVPMSVGIGSLPWANLGKVNNTGVDVTIDYQKRLGDFTVGIRGNINWNRAIIIDDGKAPFPYPWQQRIGRKLGQRYGYIALGLFQSEEDVRNSPYQPGVNKPGDIKYKDLNGDGKIDAYDQTAIGHGSIPEIVYGFGPTIKWKNWSLATWFKGISNVDIFLNGDGLQPFRLGGERGNLFKAVINRWTPENPSQNVLYPRLTYGSDNMNYETSTWWTKNGAFLRLQTAELNYSFANKAFLSKIGISNLNVYFIGYNLLTFSEFKLWDVELGDGRGSQYPLLKTYNLGIRCTF
ncbi:TonB-dependent receptor [Mucilaginibacter aquariorum]|uniref:TonB-dependent receptor n=1 Tax=Mucilaginibacter aquariorum TaxID=2967225 RepID=A0ABT1T7Z9_9SPHI|nr:TonB-dependent receptor [Mucilaginibacter aquariorum]MCQ6960764.1 TonB-dependent receptor [Mucilaginibacter aquariorum]